MKLCRLAIIAAFMFVATLARADPQTEASALFERGITALNAGDVKTACELLATSLQKWSDSGTKGALAECQTRQGKVATAYALWKDLAATAPTTELRADATENATKLEARLPRVIVTVTDPADDMSIVVNGSRVEARHAQPFDPGPGHVEVTAAGYRPWRQDIVLVEGKTLELAVPVLEEESTLFPTIGTRTFAISLGGAGVMLAAAVAFKLWGDSDYNDAIETHDPAVRRSSYDNANAKRHIAIGLLTAGVIGGAVASVLHFSGHHHHKSTEPLSIAPVYSSQQLTLVLDGSF
ncbi:MAG TPA: hypothetical protein VGO00_04965 [Kofleriaceae bacterium]|nr:hypothetical protein [Kofleriaceae bacterium]